MKRLALITGASSGIGEGYARTLARQGYDLIIVARRMERLNALKAELEAQYGVQVEVLAADLNEDADITRVEQRIRSVPALSLLINNAGFDQVGDFAAVPLERHLAMLKVHVETMIRLCHAALPAMRQHHAGAIINVASMGGLSPLPQNSLYCATKAAMVMFSKVLAGEERRHNIAVQALCPGYTSTEIFDTAGFAGFRAQRIPRFLWMSADAVVQASLRRLRVDQAVIIPGWRNRLFYVLVLLNPFGERITRQVWRRLYSDPSPER